MPIFSYIAYPENGRTDEMIRELDSFSQCEVKESTNREIVILVTDTKNNDEEEKLQKKLKNVTSLQCLSMVFGHTDSIKEEN